MKGLDKVKEEKVNPINKAVRKASKELSYKIETYVRLRIQPKPKWLPQKLWEKILKRLLVMEYFKKDAQNWGEEEVGDTVILCRSFDGGKTWEYFKTAHTKPPYVVMADKKFLKGLKEME